MRWLPIAAVLLAPTVSFAGPKLTLDDTIAKALANPKAQMAEGDRESAAARVDEADAARLPRIKLTAFGTISPKITCDDPNTCVKTEPQNFALEFDGFYGNAQLDITQPLYTFGKIGHARAAARAGLDAQRELENETAGDLAVDAARAYWGVKVARELVGMLDDGIEQVNGAVEKLDPKDTSIADKQRIQVLLAEAKAQRAEAAQQEQAALAGLRAITGIPDADVDDTLVEPIQRDLPDDAKAASTALEGRPQLKAARDGAVAADELMSFEKSQYYPDIAIVASAVISRAQGTEDAPSAFFYDPYNRTGAGVVLGLQWTIEPWNVSARTGKARGAAHRMHAQADLAAIGARYDASSALAEAHGAHDKLAAREEGQTAAKKWLAAVLQNQAIGTAEPKDLADAFIAWFQQRALWGTAVFQWNVAVVRLDRALGEFHANGYRPR